jgi:thermostable 8-oxoguanine DNA glycosylase
MTLTQTLAGVSRVVTLNTDQWGSRDVAWGESWEHGTAAYWLEATRRSTGVRDSDRHQLTDSLHDEVALCMLGGFGMPYELALAAFTAVHEQLLSHTSTPTEAAIEAVLLRPLNVGKTARRYRFPHQRARRLSQALRHLHSTPAPEDPLEIRDWLTSAPGIGPKTASWIVRNRWPDAPVAILDVHVLRAGVRATVFPENVRVSSAYRQLEALFVAWAGVEGIRPSDLDSTIWAEEAFRARNPF